MNLVDRFAYGLGAPIALTWELTYACNLACIHCLSSSGRRDPRELSTAECRAVIDELERMQVFYVNIGGGEPTVRRDFWELAEYATAHHVGVKFSTNGSRITPERAEWLAQSELVDVQVSLDGATAEVNDRVRGTGSWDMAVTALRRLHAAGMKNPKLSVVSFIPRRSSSASCITGLCRMASWSLPATRSFTSLRSEAGSPVSTCAAPGESCA